MHRCRPSVSKPGTTSITKSSNGYDFTIINTGIATAFFNKFVLQNWLSHDNIYNTGDAAAGGMLLSGTGVDYLLPNQIYSGSFNANHTDISSYDYLIVQIIPSSVIECDTEDNEFVSPTVELTSSSSPTSADITVIWYNDIKSFIATQWNSKDVAGGSTPLELPSPEIYMLVVSDGKNSVTKNKILYLKKV